MITVNDQKQVWVNGLPVRIPLEITNVVKFELTGDVIVLQTPQVQVTFGPNRRISVSVSPALTGKVCGACGNFNYTPADDLKGPGGVNVSSVPELLLSWTARDFAPLCA
ncbi:kielin/chordin-like protein [Notechis scutatus]|uniref:Kielin/chordin-like protein n=1 Tax=Notechis scutatus TaxID=8663 RepID=A0A6J1VWI5_9SAUR|nr:kielin/chordin-like protein [Notechis scutatus]